VLFEQEVPEIQEKIVEIKAVAREPGTRSKIAVVSHDDRVDAVGSCVGMKGSRVQAVTRELAGERIDIVPWSAEASLLISRALSPAEVSNIVLHPNRREATVVVTEDQLSKAIGKEGKNVRLAAKLTEWKIDLMSTREYSIRQRIADEMSMELEEMTGMTTEYARNLAGAGILTLADLAEASDEQLGAISAIPLEESETLRATAQATLEELGIQIEQAVQEELAAVEAEERALFDESQWADETAAAAAEEAVADTDAEPEAAEEPELVHDPFAGFETKIDPSELSEETDETDEMDETDEDDHANAEAGEGADDAAAEPALSGPEQPEDADSEGDVSPRN
jgi:N utilization substance protein A